MEKKIEIIITHDTIGEKTNTNFDININGMNEFEALGYLEYQVECIKKKLLSESKVNTIRT